MFKATEVERKTRKINLLIDLQKLIFSSIISHYLSCKCRKDSLGTKNVSSTHVQNWKVNKSLRQKRCGKWYHVYPPEIIQSTLLGRLRKNHCKTMTACIYSARIRTESQKTSNGQCPQSAKLLSNKLSKFYSNAFKTHSNNTGTICFNIILQT